MGNAGHPICCTPRLIGFPCFRMSEIPPLLVTEPATLGLPAWVCCFSRAYFVFFSFLSGGHQQADGETARCGCIIL